MDQSGNEARYSPHILFIHVQSTGGAMCCYRLLRNMIGSKTLGWKKRPIPLQPAMFLQGHHNTESNQRGLRLLYGL